MPFASKAQARYMFANHPKIAQEFADKTTNMKKLPEHDKDKKGKPRRKHGLPMKPTKATGMTLKKRAMFA